MKKFVAGVGKTFNYASDGTLLWIGKTLLSSSIEITTSAENINAGVGNALQMVYYHTSQMMVTQEDAQFNLALIAKTIGSEITVGADVWKEENVTLADGLGTVLGTPVATFTGDIYGWVEFADGSTERVTFSGKNFAITDLTFDGSVCIRYNETNNSARQLVVNANIIPAVVRTVIEGQLFSGENTDVGSSSLVGKVLIEIPRLQLSGASSLNLSTTGVVTTPLSGMALSVDSAGCTSTGIYATITEVVDNSKWYDNVNILAPELDPIALTHPATYTMKVWAVPTNGDLPFIVPNADLTFSSGTAGTATIGANTGVITTVAGGSSLITATITGKNTVKTTANLVVS